MKKLLVIAGPTGIGKTKHTLALAATWGSWLISADSRQVYTGMDIGTGKEVAQLRAGKASKHDGYWLVERVPIYMYDILPPSSSFSVVAFQQKAYDYIGQAHDKDVLPILVGGTGLYIQAVVDGLKVPKVIPDQAFRESLGDRPLQELVDMLMTYDPLAAKTIDMANPRRIIRALEILRQTGKSIVELKEKYAPRFDILQIGLTGPREALYQRADAGVERWFELGFVDEVKGLLAKGYPKTLSSMTSIGYRHVIALLEGTVSEENAKQRIKFELHNYIRRQLSWFKRDKRIRWFDGTDPGTQEQIADFVKNWYNAPS